MPLDLAIFIIVLAFMGGLAYGVVSEGKPREALIKRLQYWRSEALEAQAEARKLHHTLEIIGEWHDTDMHGAENFPSGDPFMSSEDEVMNPDYVDIPDPGGWVRPTYYSRPTDIGGPTIIHECFNPGDTTKSKDLP